MKSEGVLKNMTDILKLLESQVISTVSEAYYMSSMGIRKNEPINANSDQARYISGESSSDIRTAPLCCIFKKGRPEIYYNISENGNYCASNWSEKYFDKGISIDDQAFLSCTLLSLAEKKYLERSSDGTEYFKAASQILDYLYDNFRNADGLYCDGDFKQKKQDSKIKLSGKPSLLSQLYLAEAYLFAWRLSSDRNIRELYSTDSEKFLSEAERLCSYAFDNECSLLSMSLKNSAARLSSLTRSHLFCIEGPLKLKLEELIKICSADLTESCEALEAPIDSDICCSYLIMSSALIEAFPVTGFTKQASIAEKLCKSCIVFLNNIDDISENGFMDSMKTSDGAEILKSLIYASDYGFIDDALLIRNITDFIFFKSGVYKILDDEYKSENSSQLGLSSMRGIYMKGYKVNSENEVKSIKPNRSFSSYEAFKASYTLLHYFLLPETIYISSSI